MDVQENSRSAGGSHAASIVDRWLAHPIAHFLRRSGAVFVLLPAGFIIAYTRTGSHLFSLEEDIRLSVAAGTLIYLAYRAWTLTDTDFAQRRRDAVITLGLIWFNLAGLPAFLDYTDYTHYTFDLGVTLVDVVLICLFGFAGYTATQNTQFAKGVDVIYSIIFPLLLPLVSLYVGLITFSFHVPWS